MLGYTIADVPSFGGQIPCILPTTSMEGSCLDRGKRPCSIIEVLRETYHEDFQKALDFYVKQCPEGALFAIGQKNAAQPRLLTMSVKRVDTALGQPIHKTIVDLLVSASIQVVMHNTGEIKVFTGDFFIRYMLNMCVCHRTCMGPIIIPASQADPIQSPYKIQSNQYLLPIMYADDYNKAARKMLELYYPEALQKPSAIDGMLLAERMSLKIIDVHFSNASGIQGQIFFDSTKVSILNSQGKQETISVKPGTILINKDCCPTYEIRNSTILHECVHMFLDKFFFLLQGMTGIPCTAFTSRKLDRSGQSNRTKTPIEWMELQAEKLPAYILMEENNTRRKIEELLLQRGNVRSPENMNWVLGQLAETFRVTKSMAKFRMIELGYQEAQGVYVYLDKKRLPDYGTIHPWAKGLTYVISLSDAASLYAISPAFASEMNGGEYVYLEGHFCLNQPRYIEHNQYGVARLTSYARTHIEECCMAFSVWGRYTDVKYAPGQAARKVPVTNKYLPKHEFVAAPGTKDREKENEAFAQDAQLWSELLRDMPDTFKEALSRVLTIKGLTQEQLALELGIDRKNIYKWSHQPRISLSHIVGICVALQLRADVCMELVRLGGVTMRNTKIDNLYRMMLFSTATITVERCNEILLAEKLPPLFMSGE